jgi:hypothetical protein
VDLGGHLRKLRSEANDLAKIERGKKWKDLSYATDFVKTDV